jgi:Ca2+-binding RTX toxin-like protein
VVSTPNGVPVFLTQGGNAATTIDVFPSGSGLFLGKVRSDIFFDGPISGTGSESFSTSFLNVKDSFNNDPLAQNWTISDNTLSGKPLGFSQIHFTRLGELTISTNGSPNSFSVTGTDGAASTIISTASNDDSFSVERTKRDTTLTINSGRGNNVTTIGASSQTLDAIEGAVVVNGGGADTLHLIDQSSVRSNTTYTLDATTFATPLTSVSYAGIQDLIVDGSAGVVNFNRDYNIRGLGATGATTINMKGLFNHINVGSTNNTLDGFSPDRSSLINFKGRMNLNGPNSIDKIVINDSQNSNPGTVYTIDPSSVTRFVPSQFRFLFSSTVTINYATGFGSSVELDTGKGGARIQDNGPNVFMTVVAGSGLDELIGPNLVNTWGVTGLNQGTLPNLAFREVESLVGGTDNDRFVFSAGARVTGRIDGGTGNNTLDYASYTTDLIANLNLGQATGAGGGIVNINNLTGGKGNDVIVGDDSDNILIGGPGRNILIGGGGSDTLNADTGGLGEDILIGGRTTFDRNTAALKLIKAEWTRPDNLLSDYKTRVGHLMSGGGLNGTIRLNATTVFADGAKDLLTTSATGGLDFLFLDSVDVLTRSLKPGEQEVNV